MCKLIYLSRALSRLLLALSEYRFKCLIVLRGRTLHVLDGAPDCALEDEDVVHQALLDALHLLLHLLEASACLFALLLKSNQFTLQVSLLQFQAVALLEERLNV